MLRKHLLRLSLIAKTYRRHAPKTTKKKKKALAKKPAAKKEPAVKKAEPTKAKKKQ